jgi:transcriptional regulator with XRE-family HTH domain
MKDRIKKIMESQHMTQQVFADFLGIGAATLSGIFNDRTRPTINIIEAIKKKLPALSTDWLMFGIEPMYVDQTPTADSSTVAVRPSQEAMLDFDAPAEPVAPRPTAYPAQPRVGRVEMDVDFMKNIDKTPRKVTEIRVFYDDQTWESFVPARK